MARSVILEADFQSSPQFIQFDGGKTISLSDAAAVFEGQYTREGRDLKIEAPDGATYKIIDYFAHSESPAIITTSGAILSGDAVNALAGPAHAGQFAQAGKSVVAASKLVNIGKIQTLDGQATIKRADGSTVKLKVGEQVFQGDVVETAKGGKVSITFTDGSIFAVSENARMVLDKMVYDPGGSSNSMLFNLVQGTFSFIAGKIASTGKMEVETPVATMGIRGTTVVANVEANTGATKFSLVNDPDGTSGRFSIFNKQTGALIGTLTATDKSLFVSSINAVPIEIPRDAAAEQSAVDYIYRAYQDFQRRGEADPDLNNQNPLIQKASFQSSGISDQPDPSDPLQSFQGSTVNNIAPLGETPTVGTLPGGTTETTATTTEEPGEAPLPPATAGDTEPAVSQPPVFNVPGLTLNVTEDGSVVVNGFSLSAGNNNPITVTITAQSTVTLASTVGLTFTTGDGTDDETMVFSGAPQDIENALNNLTYFPTPDNDVSGGLTIELDDGNFVVTASLGVNITPVPENPRANNDSFTIVEDNVLNGDITADNGGGIDIEPDTGDSFSITQLNDAAASFGSATTLASGAQLTLQSNGAFSYTPSDSLTEGQIFNDSFTYTIQDTSGGTDTATVSIQVTGVNDPPVVSAVTNPASVPEGNTGILSNVEFDLTSYFTASDIDDGETPAIDIGSIVIAANAANPALNITPFQIFPSNPTTVVVDTANFDALAVGESAIVDVTFNVVSGADTISRTVQLTVDGLNDAPVVSAVTNPAAVLEGDTGVVSNVSFDLTSYFTASDVDNGEMPAIDTGSIVITANAANPTLNVTPFQIFPSNPTTVVVDTANYDFLAAGESAIVDVTFNVVSGADTVSRTVQLTVIGANDAPGFVTAATVQNETLTFEGTKTGDNYSEGSYTLSLQDLVNSPAFSLVNIGGDSDQEAQLNSSVVNEGYVLTRTDGGTFSFNGVTIEQNSGSSVTFRDAAGNQSSHGAGTLSFPTTFNDTTSITIYGDAVLDDILLSYAPSTNAGAVTELAEGSPGENTQNHTATGRLTFTDNDVGDSHSVSSAAQGANYLGMFNAVIGDAATGDGTGRVDWTFTVNDAALDNLQDGEVRTQLYDVTINDGSGSVTETVSIAITGENDAPVISTIANTLDDFSALPEFSTLPVNYAGFNWANANRWFTLSGVELRSQDNAPPNLQMDRGGEYFVFNSIDVRVNGNSYTISLEGFRDGALVAQETVTITTSYTTASFSTDVLVDTVRVTNYRGPLPNNIPKNDGVDIFFDNFNYGLLTPIGAGASPQAGAIAELPDGDAGENTADLSANGSIVFNDTDISDNHTVNFTPQGVGYLGTFSPVLADPSNGDGLGRVDWTFTVNDSALDSLAAGQALTQRYDITIDDGTNPAATRTVEITINGSNDAPVVSAVTNPAAVPEGNTGILSNVVFDLRNYFTASDIDNGETPTIDVGSIVVSDANSNGFNTNVFAVSTTQPTLTVDTANFDSLTAGQQAIFDIAFNVVSGSDTVGRTAQITITGANDAPVVSTISNPTPVPEGDVGVLTNVSFDLNNYFTATDVDQGDTPSIDTSSIVISANPTSDTQIISPFVIFPTAPTVVVVDTANYDFLNSGQQAVVDVTFDVVSGSDRVARTATFTIIGQTDATIFEDFESGTTTGWIEQTPPDRTFYEHNKIDATETPGFTTFLGRFSGTGAGGPEGISKTFALSGTQDSITVSFDFYEINSWDGINGPNEAFRVFADSTAIINDQHQMNGGPASFDHTISASSVADRGFPNQNGDPNFDQIWRYEFTLETSSASFALGFGAILDTGELRDESFGIDNLSIVENSDILVGTTGDDVLRDGDGAFDVIQADAGNDIVILEATADIANTFNPNFTNVDGGTGLDILRLDDAGDLDLTGISDLSSRLKSIEKIDLNQTETNVLTLSQEDVFDLSETANTDLVSALSAQQPGLNISTDNNLVVSGGSGDQVNLVAAAADGSWQDTNSDVTVGGEQHNVFNYTSTAGDVLATVAIETDVSTTT